MSTVETDWVGAHVESARSERVQLRARGVEWLVEAALVFGFLAVALAMALLLPPLRASTYPPLQSWSVRTSYAAGQNSTSPTPYGSDRADPGADALPLANPAVPLAVACSELLGRGYDYASGHTSVHRAFHTLGDCWRAVGPALVLVAAGGQVFSWDEWSVYLVALLVQFVFDFVPAAIRERFVDGVSVRTLSGLVAPITR